MTTEQLQQLLNASEAQHKDGTYELPKGRTLTIHLSSGGVGLSVARVVSVQENDGRIEAVTTKKVRYFFHLSDVFACAVGEEGENSRKAGFGAD